MSCFHESNENCRKWHAPNEMRFALSKFEACTHLKEQAWLSIVYNQGINAFIHYESKNEEHNPFVGSYARFHSELNRLRHWKCQELANCSCQITPKTSFLNVTELESFVNSVNFPNRRTFAIHFAEYIMYENIRQSGLHMMDFLNLLQYMLTNMRVEEHGCCVRSCKYNILDQLASKSRYKSLSWIYYLVHRCDWCEPQLKQYRDYNYRKAKFIMKSREYIKSKKSKQIELLLPAIPAELCKLILNYNPKVSLHILRQTNAISNEST